MMELLNKVAIFGLLVFSLCSVVSCGFSKQEPAGPATQSKAGKRSISIKSNPQPKIDFSKGTFYADVDINELRGVGEISKDSFPSIYIEEVSKKEKKVLFRRSEISMNVITYTYKNGYWMGVTEEKTDTGFARIYRFIEPGRIVDLYFEGARNKENFHLHCGYILEGNKKTWYTMFGDKGFDTRPDLSSIDLLKKNYNSMSIDEYTRWGERMFVESKTIDRGSKTPRYQTGYCYEVGNHSLIWADCFGVQCREWREAK